MRIRIAAAIFAVAAPLCAQLPALRVDAAAPMIPGSAFRLPHVLVANPGHPYAILVDIDSGPVSWLGTRIELGLTPAIAVLDSGITNGVDPGFVDVPPNLPPGTPFYLQAIVFDGGASTNGVFVASNPESTIPYDGLESVLVDRFDLAVAEGFTGNFDPLAAGVLKGGAVRRRVHSTVDPQGFLFGQPILTPLNPDGTRAQLVYRPVDLGATGEEERIVAVRWRPAGPVVTDRFAQFEMWLGHTHVTPDYTVDPWSALPAFPNSGLNPTFAANYDPASPPVPVFRGAYDIAPSMVRADGYVPYPAIRPFTYDGVSSLLVEFRLPPQPAIGRNGQQVALMVTSSPMPAARNVAAGAPGMPVDPSRVTTGRGDNAMYDYQIEFVRTKTVALSPWRRTRAGADYQPPYLATTVPPGTRLGLEFRGADDDVGSNATAWSPNIDGADGRSHVQYRVIFEANAVTAAVPSIDTLVLRYR